MELDGWLALGAHLPPKEKRGLVLVDPPFEEGGEFDRLVEGLAKAHRRWPGGIYALWYPVKDRAAATKFRTALRETGIPKILDMVFAVRAPSPSPARRERPGDRQSALHVRKGNAHDPVGAENGAGRGSWRRLDTGLAGRRKCTRLTAPRYSAE